MEDARQCTTFKIGFIGGGALSGQIKILKNALFGVQRSTCQLLRIALVVLVLSGVTGTFANGQVPTDWVPVDNDCNFQLQVHLQHPSCQNSLNGSIIFSTNATTNLDFSWINLPIDGPEATGLDAGTYSVIVSNPECADTLEFTLSYNNPILANPLNRTICGPEMVDFLQNVSGGSNQYNIHIATVFGTAINCNTCPTSNIQVNENSLYQVTIRDAEGDCFVQRSVSVEVLPALIPEATQIDDSCNGNGVINVNAVGGSGNYQFSLDGDNYQNSGLFDGLQGDSTYLVTVRDTAGCRRQTTITLEQTYTIPELGFQVSQPVCYQAEDGLIEGFSVEPLNDFQFALLHNEDGTFLTDVPVFDGLGAGNYTFFAVNDQNCYIPLSDFSLVDPLPIVFASAAQDPPCPGGSGEVSLTASGGNGDFLYSINGIDFVDADTFTDLSAGIYTAYAMDIGGCVDSMLFLLEEPEGPSVEFVITPSCPYGETGIVIVEAGKLVDPIYYALDTLNFQIGNEFYNLAAGPDTIYIQDSEGCIFTYPIYIPLALPPNLSLELTDITCPGGNDGRLNIALLNGMPLEQFQFSLDGIDYSEDPPFEQLTADIYTLYVKDTVPCVHEFYFLLDDPPAWTMSPEISPVICFGAQNGSVNLVVGGATPPYRYALDDANFQDTSFFDQLSAGQYTALLLDSNNCAYAQNIAVDEPAALFPELTVINETCNNQNGAIVCSPSGGMAPYLITWSTGDTSHYIEGLNSGDYKVSMTDAAGCTTDAPAIVADQDGPSLLGDINNVNCHGWMNGEIDLSVFGGTSPYFYSWSNGTHTEDLSDLPAGTYVVTVTDVHLCSSTKSFEIFEPEEIALSFQSGQGSEGWYINLIVEGGQAPYFYEWSNGEMTEDLFNLSGGTYQVTVTDSRDCQEMLEVFIESTAIKEPEWSSGMRLFPNPVKEALQLELMVTSQVGLIATIVSIQGQTLSENIRLQSGVNTLPVEHLPVGMYLLRIGDGEAVIFRKFVRVE